MARAGEQSGNRSNGDGGDESFAHTSEPGLVSVPVRIYPLPVAGAFPTAQAKRRQVKNACTNCQKACKKCDQARPCLRCVKYGYGAEECMDSSRKERKKGAKRGPYKRRDETGSVIAHGQPSQEGAPEELSSVSEPLVGQTPIRYTPAVYTRNPGAEAYSSQLYPTYVTAFGESSTFPHPSQLLPATFMAPCLPYIHTAHPDAQSNALPKS
ncbi:hypothetical protein GGX14DRAFT_472067 [Mycena pura]|uniref:Transcription activator of gluconeogenesis ERT1 n=1 Tax=Mycena pura TaxID=153505 RepID=A0AAD6V1L9_9AGAR|nr:hypothetical protein GGX14DRAFT_472067 [Mycena pura]